MAPPAVRLGRPGPGRRAPPRYCPGWPPAGHPSGPRAGRRTLPSPRHSRPSSPGYKQFRYFILSFIIILTYNLLLETRKIFSSFSTKESCTKSCLSRSEAVILHFPESWHLFHDFLNFLYSILCWIWIQIQLRNRNTFRFRFR